MFETVLPWLETEGSIRIRTSAHPHIRFGMEYTIDIQSIKFSTIFTECRETLCDPWPSYFCLKKVNVEFVGKYHTPIGNEENEGECGLNLANPPFNCQRL